MDYNDLYEKLNKDIKVQCCIGDAIFHEDFQLINVIEILGGDFAKPKNKEKIDLTCKTKIIDNLKCSKRNSLILRRISDGSYSINLNDIYDKLFSLELIMESEDKSFELTNDGKEFYKKYKSNF